MSTIKNKIISAVLLAAFFLSADPVSNSTEHLSLKIDDVSFNLFTLTLFAKNFSIIEKIEENRDILKVDNLKISLELARSLLLWRFQIDCFLLENVSVNILEDETGENFLFDKKIPEDEINKLFGGDNSNKHNKTKTEIDLSIPFMEIKNLNIFCNDYTTKKFLWSINNLNLFIYDFVFPPEKNKDLWSIFLSANINNDTNSALLFSAKCRTVPENSFLKLKINAEKFDWNTFDAILGSSKKAAEKPQTKKLKNSFNDDSSPFNAVMNCFSNEIERITSAFDKKISEEKFSRSASNFFNNTSLSNLIFYFNWNLEISNHIFKSGNIRLKMLNAKTNISPLLFEYNITNSAEILVPCNNN